MKIKNLKFISAGLLLLIVVLSFSKPAQADFAVELHASHHGVFGSDQKSNEWTLYPADATIYNYNYTLTGHRHGGSGAAAFACILAVSGAAGVCHNYFLSGNDMGFEYGNVHPEDPQVGNTNINFNPPPVPGPYKLFVEVDSEDSELWMHGFMEIYKPNGPPSDESNPNDPAWLTFTTTDACTGAGVGGASISLNDGQTGITDGNGYLNFTIEQGPISWTIDAVGFDQNTGSDTITGDTPKPIALTRSCAQPPPPLQPPGPPQPPPPPPATTYTVDGWVYYDTNGNGAADEPTVGSPSGGVGGAHIYLYDSGITQLFAQTTTSSTSPLFGYFALSAAPGDYMLVLDPIPSGYTITSGGSTVGTSNRFPMTISASNASHSFGLNSMSGALTPATSSCTINSGQSSCNINFSWSTTNPIATSSVTSNTNNSGASSSGFVVAGGNSGGPTAFAVPYSTRTFYLYNNSQLLDQKTVTSSCVSGTGWNGTSCVVTPINGVCSPTHYLCVSGSSVNNVSGATTWTWGCNGLNGGSAASPSCSENKGTCPNGATNPPVCDDTTNVIGQCNNGAANPPACTVTTTGTCVNGATNPPQCTINSSNVCLNGAVNPPLCTLNVGGTCLNGAVNPPLCTVDANGICLNGAVNPPTCDQFPRKPVYKED